SSIFFNFTQTTFLFHFLNFKTKFKKAETSKILTLVKMFIRTLFSLIYVSIHRNFLFSFVGVTTGMNYFNLLFETAYLRRFLVNIIYFILSLMLFNLGHFLGDKLRKDGEMEDKINEKKNTEIL